MAVEVKDEDLFTTCRLEHKAVSIGTIYLHGEKNGYRARRCNNWKVPGLGVTVKRAIKALQGYRQDG